MTSVKELLDKEVLRRNRPQELDGTRPDPIIVAKEHNDPKIALVCALFAYGNVRAMLAFLQSLDFGLLQAKEEDIFRISSYYRFQKPLDVANLFLTLKRAEDLQEIFLGGYRKEHDVQEGLKELIGYLYSLNSYRSYGYKFLLGSAPKGSPKGASPLKRWNMFLRWMVRKDHIDMGLWSKVDKKDLIVPLDTHTFHTAIKLELLKRRRYDMQAALELTQTLRDFDADDPVRYDFALYRLGQEKLV